MTLDTAIATREELQDLLFEEAHRLDTGALDDWLELFTEDARYWVPMGLEDPGREPSLILDDRRRMEERVFRLMDTPAYAQMPASRTQHDITNVRIDRVEDDDVVVTCNVNVHEVRIGDPSQVGLGRPRAFPGRCEYRIRRVDGQLRIAAKTVRLLNRELPQYNLTFVI